MYGIRLLSVLKPEIRNNSMAFTKIHFSRFIATGKLFSRGGTGQLYLPLT